MSLIFWYLQRHIRPQKVAEIKECWRRRYASFPHLQLDEISELNPHFREHVITARRELPV